jgi:hypothetical protein
VNELKLFPLILRPADRALGCPEFIRWDALSDGWAYQNHSQTLERLARRGGLSPCEAAAVIERRQWRRMPDAEAVEFVKRYAPTGEVMFYILCKERSNGLCLWWRAERHGYTTDLTEAGKYPKAEAESIYKIRGTDFPVPVNNVLKVRRVVSVEDGDNFDALRMYECYKFDTGAKP